MRFINLYSNNNLNNLIYHTRALTLVIFLLITNQVQSQKNIEKSNRFIIDSVSIDMHVQEKNFLIHKSEVYSINVITNKNRIKRLGFYDVDSLTYILTKRFINRSDSLKRIPSTRKMVNNNASWYYNNQPYNGHYINYHINGFKKEEGFIKNGKVLGEVRYYFKNGNLSNVRNFINNFLVGIQTNYHFDGSKMSTINYSRGKKNGEFVEYFSNGQIKSRGNYIDGNLAGNITDYYSNGLLKYSGTEESKYSDRFEELEYMHNLSDGHQIVEHVFDIKKLSKRKLKKLEKCQYKFNSIIGQGSIIEDYYLSRGIIYLIKGDLDLALNDFVNVLEIEPLNYLAKYYGVLALMKKYEKTSLENIPAIDKSVICASLEDRVNDNIHKLHEVILTEYYKYCEY